ncbi:MULTISPECIES: GlxA family transcriptional regulator [Kitasatospora]|uniref:Putative AraC family transcriptional regulator n=1 Tax=Kitasatospora setae (strain ATCC 33774 / DSM 43861 / JCM 3304 / KCC A-0304 / NBRC 14216 / KM-6054) TaxID=452652 RepID=E4NE26_KITSK|nr:MULTISPECIES: GlxA family transcriptional regulator [Kitasatospora]BAJ29457.1 putative AraC family transcriptional regulator [Kitasatospora setae KM-6054]
MPTRSVLIVLFDGVQSLDVTGPLEVFHGGGYTVTTASPGGRPVRSSSGLTLLPDADLDLAGPAHTLIVPGGTGSRGAVASELSARIAALAAGAERVVAVCTGTFLLAEAGLLAGRRVTTHWRHCATLAARHPELTVDPEPIYVRDGRIFSSAGVTAGIDLALHLVEEDQGREVALAIARNLVVFLRRPGGQAQFSAQLSAQLAERDSVREVQRWITEHPEEDLSVEALARRVSLSPRQFARVFTSDVGVTPGRYVAGARLEAARRRLEDSRDGIEQVARSCGYGSAEAMRRAFARSLATTPADYRRRTR